MISLVLVVDDVHISFFFERFISVRRTPVIRTAGAVRLTTIDNDLNTEHKMTESWQWVLTTLKWVAYSSFEASASTMNSIDDMIEWIVTPSQPLANLTMSSMGRLYLRQLMHSHPLLARIGKSTGNILISREVCGKSSNPHQNQSISQDSRRLSISKE